MINYTKEDLIELEKPSKPIKAIKINEDVFIAGPDITKTTADTNTVLKGYKFYNAYGKLIEGEAFVQIPNFYKCIQVNDDGTWIAGIYKKSGDHYQLDEGHSQKLQWTTFRPSVGEVYTTDALLSCQLLNDSIQGDSFSASLQTPFPTTDSYAGQAARGFRGNNIYGTPHILWAASDSSSPSIPNSTLAIMNGGVLFRQIPLSDLSEGFTMSIWCKVSSPSSPAFDILSIGNSDTYCKLYKSKTAVGFYMYKTPGTYVAQTVTTSMEQDYKWHNFAAVYNKKGFMQLYIDGHRKAFAFINWKEAVQNILAIGGTSWTETSVTNFVNREVSNVSYQHLIYFAKANIYSYAKNEEEMEYAYRIEAYSSQLT